MEKENNKSIGEKLDSLTNFIKNAKFLLLTAMTLLILGVAIISGDGKNIALSFYESVTGQKFQSFSPVQDHSNEMYLILKGTLSRDTNIRLKDVDITVFEESDTSHKYRVGFNEEVYFYIVKKKPNGTWQIIKE